MRGIHGGKQCGSGRHAGFRFVGPTSCYALMQAVGTVNDHPTGCFRHAEPGG